MLLVFFFQLTAKRLMTQLPCSSRVNRTEAPCWLLHAVTWEWRSTIVLTLWIWTPQRQACHSANHSICLETQYGHLGCELQKDARGAGTCQPTFSCRSFSLIFLGETTLCRERLKEETRFHGRFKAVIKHAVFSEIIQQFDTFIVYCLIYGFPPHNKFMLLFPLWNMSLYRHYSALWCKASLLAIKPV